MAATEEKNSSTRWLRIAGRVAGEDSREVGLISFGNQFVWHSDF
jgi:hypothetical protein